MELANLACEQGEGKEREEEKGACRNRQGFDFQMTVLYVMFKLTVQIASTTRTTNFGLITQLRS